jgi:hypothetical protein
MSARVVDILNALRNCAETITVGYEQGRIYKTEDNARDIERLKQLRLLAPDIEGAYRLRFSLRDFLDATLNRVRLFSVGANIGKLFDSLAKLVDSHSRAVQNGDEAGRENYQTLIMEMIGDIADAIDDDLTVLDSQMKSGFAAVSTLAEKIEQNKHYQQRAQELLDILEAVHFTDIEDMLEGHDELVASFRALLSRKMPAFRSQFGTILNFLNQYLFELRQIELRTKRVRTFALHVSRNPSWLPKDWDEAAELPEWLRCATSLPLSSSPDVSSPESDEFLAEVARSTSRVYVARNSFVRRAGKIDDDASANLTITIEETPIQRAVRRYFKEAKALENGLSARAWWAANADTIGSVREDVWVLRVLIEHASVGKTGEWALRVESTQRPVFTANILISDVTVLKRAA